MRLARVVYELFDRERDCAAAADRGDPVHLDRELRLELADGDPVFVAWTWGTATEDYTEDCYYHVGWQRQSFCAGEEEFEYDASRSPLWHALIGREVRLAYRDPSQQVLEVKSDNAVVFCCTYEGGMWGMDTLWVSRELPAGADQK